MYPHIYNYANKRVQLLHKQVCPFAQASMCHLYPLYIRISIGVCSNRTKEIVSKEEGKVVVWVRLYRKG